MVLHELSDNYASQHEITHNSLRKLEKKKSLNSTIYHDIAKYDTRYLMLDNMLYHKIVIDSSFSNELYPCAPIVRLVIFLGHICLEKGKTEEAYIPQRKLDQLEKGEE